MEPFTQADTLQLARLQQAMSQARQMLDDGEVDEAGFAGLNQQIQQRMNPLQQRQQQAKQKAEQEQQDALTKQHAQTQSMEQQAAEFRSQGLQKRVATYTDPMTGQTLHLYEEKPGHWAQLKFDEQHTGMPAKGGANGG